ncbi:UDP-N-acetylmuramoyl-tripeptide--D-alanyl-D-alanine ligase [Nocardia sp. GAS34]|uniref:UDP-N-acetylmuramoyl-tripeptide--D-alanyl-D- alanine ligase n=1 Tax=unclassified Nocardia TaxID=2637762 RepID=UPI003D235840
MAIAGARVDGHDHGPEAIASGAVGVLAARPVGTPAVVVPDVVAALGRLAHYVLGHLDVRVLAVTGSSGKTTTKDLLAHVLARHGETVATPGSFNTEVGLPLTVLRAKPTTRFLVLEMGARHLGDIAYLTGLTPPSVGVVLNVGTAHVGVFGSREAIADAKSELVHALPPADQGGQAILNADDDLVAAMATRTTAAVLTYGTTPTADVRATDIRVHAGRPAFTLHTPDGTTAPATLQLLGAHQVHNALAVAAAAFGVGMSTDAIAHGLSTAVPTSTGRLEILEHESITIVNDAFNANPDSVHAALDTLVTLADGQRRTIAVLGDMRELGDTSTQAHHDIGARVGELGINILITYGHTIDMHTFATAARGTAPSMRVIECVDDLQALHELLIDLLDHGDIILIKASRSVGLERFGNTFHAAVSAGT